MARLVHKFQEAREELEVTDTFVRVSSRLLLSSMVPLELGICLDFYLVGRIIMGTGVIAALAAIMLAFFSTLWFVLPRLRGLQKAIGGPAA